MGHPVPDRLRNAARRLRRKMTVAERALWARLRDHRFFGAGFRRQVPIGPYVVDFVSHAHRLVVEVDGGHHDIPARRDHDRKRDAFLTEAGYRVLRVWNSEVIEEMDGVLHRIGVAMGVLHAERLDTPHPNPPPQGGRERDR